MDKYEYNLKLEEIDKLVDRGDYEEAAEVADAVDWRRVRNVRTLCLISEIYEAAGRLEDSKRILERAYRKSPVGKNVLYRLVEVTTALQQYDEAMEYYSDYVQVAPHDDNRYILKYRIYRGRGSSVEDQIEILEEYLGQEYTERWAYELAQLYRQAGQMQKCLAACDDLVLWFHSGKYVQKALELKKKYAALTPKQQQIYDECLQEEEREKQLDSQLELEAEEPVAVTTDDIAGDVLAERIMADTEKEIAEQVAARKAELEANGTTVQEKYEKADQLADTTRNLEQPSREMDAKEQKSPEQSKLDVAANVSAALAGRIAQMEVSGEAAAEDKETAAEKAAPALEKAAGEAAPVFDKEKFQMGIARDMQKIVSSVARKPEIPDEDLPASVENRIQMTQKVEAPRVQQPTAGKLSIDDILLSMGEKGKEIAEKASYTKKETEEERRQAELAQIEQRKQEELIREEKLAEAARQEEVRRQMQLREAQRAAEAQAEQETAAKTMADVAQEELTDAQREALQYTSHPEKLLRNRSALPTYEEELAAGETRRMPDREELMAAARQGLQEEEKIRLPKEQAEKKLPGTEAKARGTGSRYAEKAEADAQQGRGGDAIEQEVSVFAPEIEVAHPIHTLEREEILETPELERGSETAEMESSFEEEIEYEAEDTASDSYEEEYGESYEEDAYEEVYSEDALDEDYEEAYQNDMDYLVLPDHLRGLFDGFTQIPELEDQIANAVIQAESKGGDRTSKTGNILIFGAHGSGKTTLAMNLAKAIAQDRGNQVVKMAKIYAADLNKKDIAATVAKIAGGTLIIEEAGDLDDNTVEQLTTAMEFRTDGLIVILEDEQKYVHELLMSHPRFTMKFTAQVYIPQYTAEELIYFGQIYANAQDYVIGEEGQKVLIEKISAQVEGGTEVTIKDVIEMVGKAIQRSNGFFRKMKMGKRRYDDNDFIVLFGKDFGM